MQKMLGGVDVTARFTQVEDVPIVPYAAVPADHPDIKLIFSAYFSSGAGIAIDHRSEEEPTK